MALFVGITMKKYKYRKVTAHDLVSEHDARVIWSFKLRSGDKITHDLYGTDRRASATVVNTSDKALITCVGNHSDREYQIGRATNIKMRSKR